MLYNVLRIFYLIMQSNITMPELPTMYKKTKAKSSFLHDNVLRAPVYRPKT